LERQLFPTTTTNLTPGLLSPPFFYTIIGIAALFIVFPSATVANENSPIAKHNGRSMSKVLVYRIGFLDLTPKHSDF
jgi:hypothetical protein